MIQEQFDVHDNVSEGVHYTDRSLLDLDPNPPDKPDHCEHTLLEQWNPASEKVIILTATTIFMVIIAFVTGTSVCVSQSRRMTLMSRSSHAISFMRLR